MRRSIAVLILMVALLLPVPASAAPFYCRDEAGVLSAETEKYLEDLGAWLDASTRAQGAKSGAQVAVVTVKDLGIQPIELYAWRRASKLGLGDDKADNGVLIAVAVKQRKIRIAVGKGLDDEVITDATAQAIIDEGIAPSLTAGDYDTGVIEGFESAVGLIANDAGLPMSNRLQFATKYRVNGTSGASWTATDKKICGGFGLFAVLVLAGFTGVGLVRKSMGLGGYRYPGYGPWWLHWNRDPIDLGSIPGTGTGGSGSGVDIGGGPDLGGGGDFGGGGASGDF